MTTRIHLQFLFPFPGENDEEKSRLLPHWMEFTRALAAAISQSMPFPESFQEGGAYFHHMNYVRSMANTVAERIIEDLNAKPNEQNLLKIEVLEKPPKGLHMQIEIHAEKESAAQGASLFEGTVEKLPHNTIVLPSSLLYHHTRRSIALGKEGAFSVEQEGAWPTYTVSTPTFKANMLMRPVSPAILAHQRGEYQTMLSQMTTHIESMDDLTADVYDIISALWIHANPSSATDMITLKADDFLNMRGLMPNPSGNGRQGGYKATQREEIARRIAALDQLWVIVNEMPVTQSENGRRGRRSIRMESKAVVVTARASAVEGENVEPYAWRLRPGDGFAEFLLSPVGREMALMSIKALEYNPTQQRWEKRLTRYFSSQWRIRQKRADFLVPYYVSTLLDAINENLDARYPARTRERLEKAMDRLQEDEVIAAWQYERGEETELPAQSWGEKWLKWQITIEPPANILEHYAAFPVEVSVTATGEAVKALRTRLGLTQMQLAEELGISRTALTQFETGRRKPSPAILQAVRNWMRRVEYKSGG